MCYTPDEVYELLRLVGINKRREKGGKGYHFMDDAERIFWICFPKHINRYRQNDVYSNWDNRHWKFSVNDAGNIRFTFIDGPVSNPPLWDRNEVTKTKRAKKREQRHMRRWGKPYRCAKKSTACTIGMSVLRHIQSDPSIAPCRKHKERSDKK